MKKIILMLTLSLFWVSETFGQLSTKFPAETMGYKPIGKSECTSMNMAGMPPMNTCEQKYSNSKLTISISITEYPKGNPAMVDYGALGNDQGDGGDDAHTYEKLVVGSAKGSITYMKSSKMATASLVIGDKLLVDVNGKNQPNGEAVKALAKAVKL
ncbi:hypothetical protein [Emticicia sp. W12TSBA100-4]|uniref:hypothetical protein n=1 Tax=Emticicia sp. W12TSBA100-4 TaxID=3160965 RepID=UPI003306031B